MRTIGSVLAKNAGVGGEFDAMRVTLAMSIVAWHTPVIANG